MDMQDSKFQNSEDNLAPLSRKVDDVLPLM